ncbi:alanine dehydrogenase [Polaribacter reichenbachii]|uniref:Alanine dehydrogenase n=1 Tax=Polaribacter reichenbachii TaxID=996801 RepID=A0A1B8TWM8_9FLAO|nr:NAD(P)-dependent oxidoreductase [Polaribacter reichenbachii]APZ45106.1 alanine dehydrogenase [Polaribacter reichenbachii]AUC18968.1 alanine dehydrogenase [Polaribacter reichenbachii]OBY63875.1 alanine dehydrogenase [Polaribacter reichenbachii]
MKFGIINERKNPPDRRVVFSPEKLQEFKNQFSAASIKVESSPIRVFSDEAYRKSGFEITENMSDCDVLLGVKEVPIDALIPNKKYFFFSHTIKKQPYNRNLLKAILDKNIELFDHETIVKENGMRLIGFGRYAGIVGAYNGFRAIGLKNKTFSLPKAETLDSQKELIAELGNIKLPNKFKILLTGNGKVAYGAKEMLDAINIKEVSVDEYLNKTFNEPVYCLADVLDYNKRKDGEVVDNFDFYNHPENYESDFMRFAEVTNFFIAGHFYGNGAPYLFTREDAKSDKFNIKFVADISCDVDGPVASTLRASTIADPIYCYNPKTEKEVDFTDDNAIVVMAVDNLPCELPKDASEGFGEMFLKNVIPAFFNDDKDGVLSRAKMTENGKLTARFSYLQDFVDGKE